MSYILSQIIKKKIPIWNQVIFTEDILLELCQTHGARHYEDPDIKIKGEYTVLEDDCNSHAEKIYYVVVNKNLKREMKLWVGLHEFGHHLLHYPIPHKFSKGTKRRMDREANFFASVAMIPTPLIEEKLFGEITLEIALGEIAEEYGYSKDLILIRKEIYEAYKI